MSLSSFQYLQIYHFKSSIHSFQNQEKFSQICDGRMDLKVYLGAPGPRFVLSIGMPEKSKTLLTLWCTGGQSI
jgi:hypothetical protein